MPGTRELLASAQALLNDLRLCGTRRELRWGRRLHARTRDDSSMYVVTALVRMYAQCSSMLDARRVFDSIQNPDVVAWNVLLLGYVENGEATETLEMFSRMKESGCEPRSMTFVAALKACASMAVTGDRRKREWLEWGRQIHLEIGSHLDHYVQNALIDMYCKCGSMAEAHRVFDGVKNPNVVCWTVLLLGYADHGEGLVALDLFYKLKSLGLVPDSVTYVAALRACTSLAASGSNSERRDYLKLGKEIHAEVGCHMNYYVRNTLIGMYAKCGSMGDARQIFDSIKNPDVVAWSSLLLGYAEHGEGLIALDLFSRMRARGYALDSITYVAALKACTSLAVNGDESDSLKRGREIHKEIGWHPDKYVQNTLICMYAKCRSMLDARSVFDRIEKPNVVSWTALLWGYVENEDGLATLEMFSRMKAQGCSPNSITYIASLKACSLVGALSLGRKFHLEIREFTAYVVTCLVDFYAKCGSMVEAREVFDVHPRARSISTWNALLAGYSGTDNGGCVFTLFEAMLDEEVRPDAITFVSMLLYCSHAGLVEKARGYFEAMQEYQVAPCIIHYNCMVDVLGRANRMNEAMTLLREMPCSPDAVSWTALMCACRKWKNLEMGLFAFRSLVDLDKTAYVLMAHIYGSKGMWDEQERMLRAKNYR